MLLSMSSLHEATGAIYCTNQKLAGTKSLSLFILLFTFFQTREFPVLCYGTLEREKRGIAKKKPFISSELKRGGEARLPISN